jgi:hypothetical protein
MSEIQKDSFLTRPPKLKPTTSLLVGLLFIPVGTVIMDSGMRGGIGGMFVGMGIGALLMAAWDSFRLWAFKRRE